MQLTLKQLRVGKKMTQQDAAKELGMSYPTYSAIENIDKALLLKLAKLYGVKPEDIKVVS